MSGQPVIFTYTKTIERSPARRKPLPTCCRLATGFTSACAASTLARSSSMRARSWSRCARSSASECCAFASTLALKLSRRLLASASLAFRFSEYRSSCWLEQRGACQKQDTGAFHGDPPIIWTERLWLLDSRAKLQGLPARPHPAQSRRRRSLLAHTARPGRRGFVDDLSPAWLSNRRSYRR